MPRAALLALLLLAGCLTPQPDARPDLAYDAIIVETGLGSFTSIVFCESTPITCTFMRGLIEGGYYDGRAFGRIIPTFVIQEVDRTGGTTDQTDTVDAEFGTPVQFSGGAWGIARNADPNSGSSEFFIMDFATSRLYGNYTAFAQVTEGMEIVHKIARVPAIKTGPASSVAGAPPGSPIAFGLHDRVPVDPVIMTHVTWTQTTLTAADAARYPIQVAETYATDTLRATLEFPHDLTVGKTSALTWYVSPRDASPQGQLQDPAPVDLNGAQLRHTGASNGTIPYQEDTTNRGKLTFDWTPTTPGEHQFLLERSGTTLAQANLTLTT